MKKQSTLVKKPPHFFLHIPKCGGSSIISFLKLNTHNYTEFVWSYDGWAKESKQLIDTNLGGGHQSYGIHRALKYPVQYFTVLRDPLQRQISHFWFAYNGKNSEATQLKGAAIYSEAESLISQGIMSIDDWLNESCEGKNLFITMLSGQHPLNKNSLPLAKENIKKRFISFGFCEDMSQFLLLFCGKTGFKLPFYFHSNKTYKENINTIQPSDSACKKFIHDNRLDYELLDFIKNEVHAQIQDHKSYYEKAIKVVRETQKAINELETPHQYKASNTMDDPSLISKINEVIAEFDLSPVYEYIAIAEKSQDNPIDLYTGHVDGVYHNNIEGWAINLTQPDKKVPLELHDIEGNVIARGETGRERPDVRHAGYPSKYTGFSIPLPRDAGAGFIVKIADSLESIYNQGIWKFNWHCHEVFN